MKIQELRVGNLISYNEDGAGDSHAVLGITERYIDTGFRKMLPIDLLFPIPIDESILLIFNFKYADQNNTGFKAFDIDGIYRIYNQGNRFELWILDRDYQEVTYCKLREIKYLHELQNLYHSLSKKELISIAT